MEDINSFYSPIIVNPADLARSYLGDVDVDNKEITDKEEKTLVELDQICDEAKLNGLYFTRAGRALAIPVFYDRNEKVVLKSFNNLTFEGSFVTYSIVKIGYIIGASVVRALCLSFDRVTLLPFFDQLPSEMLLHVPVLAVDSMSRSD